MQVVTQFFPFFLLVCCRITSFFVVAPVFSSRGVPLQFKIGLSFFMSLLTILSLGPHDAIAFDADYFLILLREILIGLILGFTAYIFFTAIQIAGSFIDIQMGFGIANVVDPMSGAQAPLMGNFKFMIAMLFFLSINGHHYLIRAIMDSYKWVPLDNSLYSMILQGSISAFLVESFIKVFYLAFQIAAPLITALFLVDVALGILARTAPQFNIFVVGFQIKIFSGFVLLIVMMSGLLFVFQALFKTMLENLMNILQLLNKG